MSANNKIKIYRRELEWCVYEVDAETGGIITTLGDWDDLESAIQCANDYMEENEVEYGLQIKL